MHRGYVNLWRKSIESEVWLLGPDLWYMWCWCLMKATHKHRFTSFKTGKGLVTVELQPGQFIYGRHSCAKALKWKLSTTHKRIKRLEKAQLLNIESNNQYSIITICNWELYQHNEDKEVTAKGTIKEQPRNSQGTQTIMYKNVKNNIIKSKNKIAEIRKIKPAYFSEEEWEELIVHRKKKGAVQSVRSFQNLINEFNKAVSAGKTANDILNAMTYGKGWAGFKFEWMKNVDQEKTSMSQNCSVCKSFCAPGTPDKCNKSSTGSCNDFRATT